MHLVHTWSACVYVCPWCDVLLAIHYPSFRVLTLFLSFRSVKFKWNDPDGMRFRNSSFPASPPPISCAPALPAPTDADTGPNPPARAPAPAAHLHLILLLPPTYSHSPAPEVFAILTNTHLESFGKDDTICVRQPSPTSTHSTHALLPSPCHLNGTLPPRRTRACSHRRHRPGCPGPPGMVRSMSSPPAPVCTLPMAGGKLRVSAREKRWSPVKGLFLFSLFSPSPPCPTWVLLPPLVSMDGDVPEEDNKDVWVDEDEDDLEGDDGRRQPGVWGGAELPTPLSWHSDLLAPHTPPVLSVNVHVGAQRTYYKSEGEGEEPQTPVPGLYSREAMPTPYTREEREREGGEGEEEGGGAGGREAEAVTTSLWVTI
ncbi:hypothetical protein B0H14DRAFT_2652353 [Mycena olivaceomarginata]|nr:hypothetical protein B0H14DRAFT_2652353 [Mycena olivaceomarginata]